jgi:hypothetical protein
MPDYAIPTSDEDPPGTSTILPVTPPFPRSSCASLASARGKRRAIKGLIFSAEEDRTGQADMTLIKFLEDDFAGIRGSLGLS